MFASLTFTDNKIKKSLVDNRAINKELKYAQLAGFSFCAVQNINSELETAVWETDLGPEPLPNYMATSIDVLVAFLNDKTSYTWTCDYDTISVSYSSAFKIIENNFSSLILGCEDFNTSATTHNFAYVGLFPYSEHVIFSNTLFPSKEMSENDYYFKSVQISGSEFWNGKIIQYDTNSLLNRDDNIIDPSIMNKSLNFNVGVKMNDGTLKKITLRKTRPFSIKIYFSNSLGFSGGF